MEQGHNRPFPIREEAKYLFLLLGLVAALFVPNLILGVPALGKPFLAELAFEYHPWKVFYRESLLAGYFPLWDPYDFSGQPLLAFSHTGFLYPLGLTYLLSFPAATTVSIMVHLLILSCSSYFLFREMGRSAPVSLIAGLSFSLSGYVFIFINMVMALQTFTWIPLLFLSALRLARTFKAGWWLSLVLSFGMSFTAGDNETLLYVIIFLLWSLAIMPVRDRKKAYLLVVLALSAGAMMSAALFLPLNELVHFSLRGQPVFEPTYSMPAKTYLVTSAFAATSLFLPLTTPGTGFNTVSFTYPIYVGFVIFLGFVMGLFSRSSRTKGIIAFFAAVLVYAVVFMTAPLHRALTYLPVVGKIFNSVAVIPAVSLGLLMIASEGIDDFLAERFPRLEKASVYFLPAYGLLVLASAFMFKLALIARLVLAAALLGFPLWRRSYKPAVWVAAIVIIDLFGMAVSYFPRTPYPAFKLDPEFVEKFSHSELDGRYLFSSPFSYAETGLPFSAGLIADAGSIDTWMRAPLWPYFRMVSIAFPEILDTRHDKIRFYDQLSFRRVPEIPDRAQAILDLVNLRWVISRTKVATLENKTSWSLKSRRGLFIYENAEALPRVKLFRQAAQVSEEQAFSWIRDGKLDIHQQLVISPAGPRVPLPSPAPPGDDYVALTRQSPQELTVELRLIAFAWLLLAENYYPGWEADLDGRPVRIMRGDYAFRAIAVPEGNHRVRFVYKPLSFRIGLWASLGSAFCWFLVAAGLAIAGMKRVKA